MTNVRPLDIMLATFAGGGNLPPVMALAEQLIHRGHRMRIVCDEVARAEAEATGAEFVAWTGTPDLGAEMLNREGGDWALSVEDANLFMVRDFMCGTAALYARGLAAELDRRPADVVVASDLLPGIMVASEARGARLAVLSANISHFPFVLPGVPPFGFGLVPAATPEAREEHARIQSRFDALWDTGLPALNAARATFGLGPLAHVSEQIGAADLRLFGTARAFDFAPDPLPGNVRYVGPLNRDPSWAEPWISPWPQDDRRPLVLVAFSTSFQNHIGVLQNVVDAAGELPVRVLLTLAGAVRPGEVRPAANTVIVESASHEQVTPQATVVVTHGGHGTTMKALTNRKPLLVIPHGRDQDDNAVRVTERGAGLSLPRAASVDEIRLALGRLLDEPAFAEGARRLGDAVADEIAGSNAAELLESLAERTHQPA